MKRTLGRYRIVRELGRGAMGQVFQAHDPEIDRPVALKTINVLSELPKSVRSEAREQLMAEARAAGRLQHPGIVAVYDVGETKKGEPYVAMELVEGQTLQAHCRPDNLLPVPVVAEIVAGVAEALDYAHRKGVVHGDVKPGNLIHVGEASAKITDFGVARPLEKRLKQEHSPVGTPAYMSPEQIRGAETDGSSDLFSLGVVLYELLSGTRPFPGDTVSSVVYRIVHEDPVPFPEDNRVPHALREFVRRCLAKAPEGRPASGEDFARALREIARVPARVGQSIPAVPGGAEPLPPVGKRRAAPAATPSRSRPPRSSPLPYVLALFVLIAAAAAAWAFRDRLGFEVPVEEPPPEVWWEAFVRSEPEGLDVKLDGLPVEAGVVRFRPEGPFGTLTAEQGCRVSEHRLAPADAGGEIVLVVDPVRLQWQVEVSPAAEVTLNGQAVGTAPVEVDLDLCEENRVELSAAGYRSRVVELASGISAVEARTQLTGLSLDVVPMGELSLPDSRVMLVYYLDGKRLPKEQRKLELREGEYRLRFKNDYLWIDKEQRVEVEGNRTVEAQLQLPALTQLRVQAFPPNCKVYLRRPGGSWRYLDETPFEREVAVGTYDVKVELNPTGQTREQRVELVPGDNPPVRISFRGES